MFLTSLSLKRPVLVTVSLLALVALGLISCFTLSINDWPEIKKPYVTITILQPGASPDQMERNVAQKVEEALSEIAGVKHVYSIIQESSVTVWAEFTMETEEEQAIQDVRDNIGLIRNELPEDIEEPVIDRFDPTAAPIMILALTGRQSVREMSILTDDMIKKRIESINGVGAVI
jgi:HAE1 family hydrophobic/amphiphilic exporter-1